MASGPIASWQIDGETVETVTDFIFWGSKITAAMKLKDTCSLEGKLAPWKENYDKLRQHMKKQRQHFADKGPCSQSCGFSCSRVQM